MNTNRAAPRLTSPAVAAVGDFFRYLPLRSAARLGVLLNRLWGPQAGAGVGILVYHRIAASVRGLPAPKDNVTPTQFRRQLVGLRERNFQFWSVRRLLQHAAAGQPIPARTVAVTFDDGYETVYLNAWPILQDLDIPATIFLATSFLDREQPFPFDTWGLAVQHVASPGTFRPLRLAQCQAMMQAGGIEFGAHTHTHQDFRRRPADFRADLEQSLRYVQTAFGVRQPLFAFPFGSPALGFAGEELVRAAKQTEAVCGLTTESLPLAPERDPFRWGRFPVFSWDTSATLAAKLQGWYSWAGRSKRFLSALLRRPTAAARPAFSFASDADKGRH